MDKYILWLPSWYPNRLNAFDGDFIQRHAYAAATHQNIHVVHFMRDTEAHVTKDMWVDVKEKGRLRETIVYYYVKRYPFWLLDRLFSWTRFNAIHRQFFEAYFREHGTPSFMHVHVAFKAGTIALALKKKYSLYYYLTEHWTVYLPEACPSFNDLARPIQRKIDKVIRNARLVLPVSVNLLDALAGRWPLIRYWVFPNVVDPAIFYSVESKAPSEKLRIMHVSTMNAQKNPDKMLEALNLFNKKGIPWKMDVFGPVNNDILERCQGLRMAEHIHFHGEHPQSEVARYLQQSDLLLLYSRFENQPCVVLEAFACGIPVVVSDIPAHRQLVKEGVTGLFADSEDPLALAEKLEEFSRTKHTFNSKRIEQAAGPFLKEVIQEAFRELYASDLE